MQNRKLILYISCSLDGYIAKPGDDLSFLDRVQKDGEDYGYFGFVSTVDTVILGRKTFDWVMAQVDEFPHANKETYVVTRTVRPPMGKVTFYTGNIRDLVLGLKAKEGKNIYCDGGAEIVNGLLREKIFDELIISVIPVLVGEGTRLFGNGRPEQGLELISAKTFDSGLVQLHYKILEG
jgi:dihydrofolate reductase